MSKHDTDLLAAFTPAQREYIEILTTSAGWRVTSVTLSREGDEQNVVNAPARPLPNNPS